MVVRGVVRAHQATAEDEVALVIIHRPGFGGLLLIRGL